MQYKETNKQGDTNMAKANHPLDGLRDTDLAVPDGGGWNRATVLFLAAEDGTPILVVTMPDGTHNKFTFHGCSRVTVARDVHGRRKATNTRSAK